MIQYFQKAKFPKNTYATVERKSEATHFVMNNGPVKSIAELQTTNKVKSINLHQEEPLVMPTMNFDNEKVNKTDKIKEHANDKNCPLSVPNIF